MARRNSLSRGFVLPFAGTQSRGESAPVGIETLVRHLEYASEIGRLVPVEEIIGRRRVGIPVVVALEEPESDKRVEKVTRGAVMETQTAGQRVELFGPFGQLGEDLHFNCAEQGLRGPECKAGLQNVFW
jgi:hypothetical protein